MSRMDDDLSAEEQRAQQALRELPAAAPDPAFRARVRREFVAGPRAARSRVRFATWPLAASILVLVGTLATLVANRGEPWRVAAATGAGVIRVDGRALDARQAGAGVLEAGALISTDANVELEIASEGALTLVLTPGSELALPAVPGRWFRRSVVGRLARGELRGATGEAFPGARLRIELPDAVAEVTGTTFALIANAEGSCVCVMEGTVLMRDSGPSVAVTPGRRRLIPRGGGSAREEPLRAEEAMKLEMLRDRVRAREPTR